MNDESPLLEMKGISKEFPGVQALAQVNFRVFAGEVMAVLGENGAGKSTLMKVLFGEYEANEGRILFRGKPFLVKSPREALAKGICLIHQELNLIPKMTVAENIFLGREPVRGAVHLNQRKMRNMASQILRRLGVDYPPDLAVERLSVGQQQMVEIAKALSFDAEVFILDEPTGSLTDKETESLFSVVRNLKASGKGVVYISHRLKEIFEICDRVTILRDGRLISESRLENLTEDELIEKMVGRKLEDQYPYEPVALGPDVFSVERLSGAWLRDVSFHLSRGELLGVTGLMGSGRTELALTIFGAVQKTSGKVFLDGKSVDLRSPSQAMRKGIIYVSEDRKGLGLLLGMSVRENVTLANLRAFEKLFFALDQKKEKAAASDYIRRLSIKTPSDGQKVRFLSGGNQQKVSIAKGLILQPKVLIIDEPTRGIDVGAKTEIYQVLNRLKREGVSIIMISSELPEILGMSDRLLVMHGGRVSASFMRSDANQEKILRAAIGANGADA